MKYEFTINDADIEDRKRIIALKEELMRRVQELSQSGQNTMSDSICRLRNDLEYMENEWLFCQRERAINKLSEALNEL